MLVKPPLPLIPAGRQSYMEVTSNKHIVLKEAEFIYIQRGAVAGPFAQAYSSPFQVLCWAERWQQWPQPGVSWHR